MLQLKKYHSEQTEMLPLIQGFWLSHSDEVQTDAEALADLTQWSSEGNALYFIVAFDEVVGFLHLGSRGGAIDWLEHLYVKPEHRNKGFGSKAIVCAEEIVREYSESLYIEAAARNEQAIRLYRSLGYNCLNSISIRKDFHPERFKSVRTESLCNEPFEIRKMKQ